MINVYLLNDTYLMILTTGRAVDVDTSAQLMEMMWSPLIRPAAAAAPASFTRLTLTGQDPRTVNPNPQDFLCTTTWRINEIKS